MKVHIQPYNPSWAIEFQNVKASLEKILDGVPFVSIEHVGSTSIPGVPAKPVLDIDIIVTLETLPLVSAAMSRAGYLDCGDLGIPGRYVFRQPGFGRTDAAFGHSASDTSEMRQNTYAMIQGSQALQNHLDLKRVLLNDEALREEYGRVKMALADQDYNNIGEYVAGKTEIIGRILKKAGWKEEDWEDVRKLSS